VGDWAVFEELIPGAQIPRLLEPRTTNYVEEGWRKKRSMTKEKTSILKDWKERIGVEMQTQDKWQFLLECLSLVFCQHLSVLQKKMLERAHRGLCKGRYAGGRQEGSRAIGQGRGRRKRRTRKFPGAFT